MTKYLPGIIISTFRRQKAFKIGIVVPNGTVKHLLLIIVLNTALTAKINSINEFWL